MGNQSGGESGYSRADDNGNYQYPAANAGGYPGNAANRPVQQAGAVSTNSMYASQSSYNGPAGSEVDGGPNASRDERAAALEARLGKRAPKKKDIAAIKDAHWKRCAGKQRA